MVIREWNALRIGDRVTLHGSGGTDTAVTSGCVVAIDVRRGANTIGIHVDGHPRPVWPARLAVHDEPGDRDESCWRCQSVRSGR